MRLQSLIANSVRGIPRDWAELPIGKKGVVVEGPNGVGKSSLVDSAEYCLSCRSTLYPERRQGVNWDAGAPHIRDGQPDIAVVLDDDGATLSLTPDCDLEELSEEQRAWVDAARNANFVLRRHMLLQFIVAEPSPRYKQVETFMNLDSYRQIEDALKDWKDGLETQHQAATADVTAVAIRLRALFELKEDAPISEDILLGRLDNVLHELKLEQVQESKKLEERKKEIEAELGGEAQNERLAALGALKGEVQQLGLAQDVAELLKGVISALDGLEREMKARTEAVLTELLMRGKEAIEAGSLKDCPVCEQPIDREAVLARLDERIAADERVTAAKELVTARCNELLPRVRELASGYKKFIERWAKHMQSPVPNASYGQTLALLDEMEAALGEKELQSGQFREFASRIEAAVTGHVAATAEIDAAIVKEGGGERRALLAKTQSMIDSLMSEWPKFAAKAVNAERIAARKKLIGRLHAHAMEARKTAVQSTFDGVAEVANGYYDRIHPGEGIATSSLEVRQAGQGSLNLWTEFYGKREHPMLHYSESHLDTLGLCYFLALRKHEATISSNFKVLVLDDVMHSVDSEHRGRIATLIKDEFSDHQVIITTHDPYFYEALRQSLGGGNYTYYRINNWDVERGPVLGDALTDFDRIMVPEEREKLARDTLAGAGGRFFEFVLREVAEDLSIAVPARFKRPATIGDLWPAVAVRLRKQKGYAAVHGALVDALDGNTWVRNACGAHYNPAPAPATLPEVQEFARLLADFYQSVHCDDCKRFITRRDDQSWQCDGSHHFYPEKAPKEEADAL